MLFILQDIRRLLKKICGTYLFSPVPILLAYFTLNIPISEAPNFRRVFSKNFPHRNCKIGFFNKANCQIMGDVTCHLLSDTTIIGNLRGPPPPMLSTSPQQEIGQARIFFQGQSRHSKALLGSSYLVSG